MDNCWHLISEVLLLNSLRYRYYADNIILLVSSEQKLTKITGSCIDWGS